MTGCERAADPGTRRARDGNRGAAQSWVWNCVADGRECGSGEMGGAQQQPGALVVRTRARQRSDCSAGRSASEDQQCSAGAARQARPDRADGGVETACSCPANDDGVSPQRGLLIGRGPPAAPTRRETWAWACDATRSRGLPSVVPRCTGRSLQAWSCIEQYVPGTCTRC